MLDDNVTRGEVIYLYSERVAQVFKDATAGMPRKRILHELSKEQIGYSTWYRLMNNLLPRTDRLYTMAKVLGVPARAIAEAFAEEGQSRSQGGIELLDVAMEIEQLPAARRLELRQRFREAVAARASPAEQQSAA